MTAHDRKVAAKALRDAADHLNGPIAGIERWSNRMSVDSWLRAEADRIEGEPDA